MLHRLRAAVDGLHARDLPGTIRLYGLLIHLIEYRRHQKPGHHQRQPHQRGIGRRRLRAQRLAQKVKDHQQPHQRRHGHQDRGQQRDQRQDQQNRPRRRVRRVQLAHSDRAAAARWPERPRAMHAITATMRSSLLYARCTPRSLAHRPTHRLVKRIKGRPALGRSRHQNPPAFGFNQRQRLARRQRDSVKQCQPRLRGLPAPSQHLRNQPAAAFRSTARCHSVHSSPCSLVLLFPRSVAVSSRQPCHPHRQPRFHHFKFGPRQLHFARCQRHIVRHAHWVSINCPGANASRLRTRNSRTGTATSSSTGKRATGR